MSLWTYDDVAEYLRLSKEAVRLKCARGQMPFLRIGEKTTRFRKEDIDAWLNRRTHMTFDDLERAKNIILNLAAEIEALQLLTQRDLGPAEQVERAKEHIVSEIRRKANDPRKLIELIEGRYFET